VIFSRANFGTLSTSLAIQACGVCTGVVTARLLGPVARGELATVILWPTVLSNLGLMGCNWALAREVAKDPARECDWATGGIAVGLGTALLYFLAGYLLMPWMLSRDKAYLLPVARLCLLLIPLDIFNQVLLSVEHGRMRWRRYNLLRLSFSLFYFGLILLIGTIHRSEVHLFVFAFLASHLLTVLVRLRIQGKTLAGGRLQFSECRHLLRAGLPYFGATAGNLISLQLDKILVVSLLSTDAAGIYAVAATFASGQFSLGDALGATSFALVSNEKDSGSQEKIITETFRQSALVSSGAALLLAGLIPFLVQPLFGFEFSRAIWPAVVLALAGSLTTSANILNQGLRGAGRPHAGLLSQLAGTAVMGVAALLLLRRFGLMGMACAVLLGGCTQVLSLVAAAANWLGISPRSFWPFGVRNVRLFFQQVASLRLRDLSSPA
jgi:O-antigen/teichoic acid export membrane protein